MLIDTNEYSLHFGDKSLQGIIKNFAEIGSIGRLQVVRDQYKHSEIFSRLSPNFFLNFSEFSYSDWKIFTKSSGGGPSNVLFHLFSNANGYS